MLERGHVAVVKQEGTLVFCCTPGCAALTTSSFPQADSGLTAAGRTPGVAGTVPAALASHC